MDTSRFPQLIRGLYKIVNELETMFPGRHFTPDGHLVGSIGEALAEHYYGLNLLSASTKGMDATLGGTNVEIKVTQGKSVAFRHEPQIALVLRLNRDGSFDEIYNGAGWRIWEQFRDRDLPSNGQYQISFAKLEALMKEVPGSERLERVTLK